MQGNVHASLALLLAVTGPLLGAGVCHLTSQSSEPSDQPIHKPATRLTNRQPQVPLSEYEFPTHKVANVQAQLERLVGAGLVVLGPHDPGHNWHGEGMAAAGAGPQIPAAWACSWARFFIAPRPSVHPI